MITKLTSANIKCSLHEFCQVRNKLTVKVNSLPFISTFLRSLTVLIATAISVGACDDGYLRGSITKSNDGKTYLSVIDDNGGKCGPIIVDDKVWPYKIGEAGPINPGRHKIECGGWMTFEIPAGVIFYFDYWGP
jgi:hypothetical protein